MMLATYLLIFYDNIHPNLSLGSGVCILEARDIVVTITSVNLGSARRNLEAQGAGFGEFVIQSSSKTHGHLHAVFMHNY